MSIPEVKRFLPYVLTVLAVVLWWPVGWAGSAAWWEFPLEKSFGAILLLGAVASATVVSALTREPWLKLGIVLILGLLTWWGSSKDAIVSGRLVFIGLLVVGSLLGLWLGARANSGVSGAATVLAALAGLSPSQWPHGPVLAVALALPFWLATRDRVAPTVFAVIRVLAVYLISAVLAVTFSLGWVTETRDGVTPFTPVLRKVLATMGEGLRDHGWVTLQQYLTAQPHWYWIAALIAMILVVVRHLRGRRESSKA